MTDHEQLVEKARGGDKHALDTLLREMKDLVFRLASRMLGDLTDAEDATQEILIRLVTSLDSFRGESAFRTWVYRVASNHLLRTREQKAKHLVENFDEVSSRLATGFASDALPAQDKLVAEEAKLICTSMMLQCLDRDHRLAFIFGDMLELSGEEAAAVLEIEPETYRKRLSRARTRMGEFALQECSLAEPSARCTCAKMGGYAVAQGYIDPSHLSWVKRARAKDRERVAEIDALERAIEVFRGLPNIDGPDSLADNLRELIAGGRLPVLS
jgi:RNA polymerase sigma factor (sigma-70 family)